MSLGVSVLCVFFNTGVFYRPPGDFLTIAICFYHFCFIIYKPGAMLKKDFSFQNRVPITTVSLDPVLCPPFRYVSQASILPVTTRYATNTASATTARSVHNDMRSHWSISMTWSQLDSVGGYSLGSSLWPMLESL